MIDARRALDIAASAAGLVALSPVLLGIGFLVKLSSPGPVFYAATRVGRDERIFRLYKFRTMVTGADRSGPGITTAQDARVTRIGAYLRRAKLDELPQLFNVLRGEMSLVGPRPEDPRYVARYTREQKAVLAHRPGITSPASLRYRNEADLLKGEDWERVYVDEILPAKLAIEIEYLRKRTLWRDIVLIAQTILGRPSDDLKVDA